MRQRTASALMLLLLLSSLSVGMASADFSQVRIPSIIDADDAGNSEYSQDFQSSSPWVESSLWERVDSGADQVRVTAITRSLGTLNQWQHDNGAIEGQKPAKGGESLVAIDPIDGQVDHRTFWMDAGIFHKLTGISGIIAILDAEKAPEP